MFEAKVSTSVIATSYFKDEAEMRAHAELCDSFGEFDLPRLAEVFGKRDDNGDLIPNEYLDGYVPLTSEEMATLEDIPCVIVGRQFFQNRKYGTEVGSPSGKATDFYNPQTLKRNHWLHEWGIMATSPFENAVVFTKAAQSVTSVTVSPLTATVSLGQSLDLKATVVTTGFANKAVTWSVDDNAKEDGITIDSKGKLLIPSTATVETVTVTATSIYDSTKTGTSTITIAKNVTPVEPGE